LKKKKKSPKSEIRNILFISISNKSVSRKRVLGPHVRGREHTITPHFTSWKHAQPKCSVSRKSPQLGNSFCCTPRLLFQPALHGHQRSQASKSIFYTPSHVHFHTFYEMFAKLLFILAQPFWCFYKLDAVKFTLVSVSVLQVSLGKLCHTDIQALYLMLNFSYVGFIQILLAV